MQGEVWAILNNKLTTAAEDGFCCLVAESAARPAGLVGIVEVSLQSEKVSFSYRGGGGEGERGMES